MEEIKTFQNEDIENAAFSTKFLNNQFKAIKSKLNTADQDVTEIELPETIKFIQYSLDLAELQPYQTTTGFYYGVFNNCKNVVERMLGIEVPDTVKNQEELYYFVKNSGLVTGENSNEILERVVYGYDNYDYIRTLGESGDVSEDEMIHVFKDMVVSHIESQDDVTINGVSGKIGIMNFFYCYQLLFGPSFKNLNTEDATLSESIETSRDCFIKMTDDYTSYLATAGLYGGLYGGIYENACYFIAEKKHKAVPDDYSVATLKNSAMALLSGYDAGGLNIPSALLRSNDNSFGFDSDGVPCIDIPELSKSYDPYLFCRFKKQASLPKENVSLVLESKEAYRRQYDVCRVYGAWPTEDEAKQMATDKDTDLLVFLKATKCDWASPKIKIYPECVGTIHYNKNNNNTNSTSLNYTNGSSLYNLKNFNFVLERLNRYDLLSDSGFYSSLEDTDQIFHSLSYASGIFSDSAFNTLWIFSPLEFVDSSNDYEQFFIARRDKYNEAAIYLLNFNNLTISKKSNFITLSNNSSDSNYSGFYAIGKELSKDSEGNFYCDKAFIRGKSNGWTTSKGSSSISSSSGNSLPDGYEIKLCLPLSYSYNSSKIADTFVYGPIKGEGQYYKWSVYDGRSSLSNIDIETLQNISLVYPGEYGNKFVTKSGDIVEVDSSFQITTLGKADELIAAEAGELYNSSYDFVGAYNYPRTCVIAKVHDVEIVLLNSNYVLYRNPGDTELKQFKIPSEELTTYNAETQVNLGTYETSFTPFMLFYAFEHKGNYYYLEKNGAFYEVNIEKLYNRLIEADN